MTLLTETRERFLLAITERVPAERIAEIHFFAPIKQGGVESGVAVAAAWPEPAQQPDGTTQELDETQSAHASRALDARHVVYMARYRHTLKGADRGKWEASVVAEADAPLITVDAVVRGVQRRAGDVDEPTRMDGNDVRGMVEALRAPPDTHASSLTKQLD